MITITYQDLIAVGDSDRARAEFVRSVIKQHMSSELFRTAKIADEYDRCRNTTTMQYQKFITDVYGRKYIDYNAVVHRSCNNYYNIFTTQLVQFLFANGVKWEDADAVAKALGADFDNVMQEAAKSALDGAVSFVFYNADHCEVFPVYSSTGASFAPLYDEENGALAAGVRFWQIDRSKPLRATLYEIDGYTDFYWQENSKGLTASKWQSIDDGVYMAAKLPYKIIKQSTAADGDELLIGENYGNFPIVPFYGDRLRQSYIVGLREKLDAYDFILNGWEDDLDLPQIMWIISGAGGMDDSDLAQFLDRLRTVKAAAPADGQEITPVPVNIPVEARSQLLDVLRNQLYTDAQAFNPADVKSGSTVVAQIEAAYEPINQRANALEFCANDFLQRLMAVAGISQKFSFTRDQSTNKTEMLNALVMAATELPKAYILEKIVNLLGDGDRLEEIKLLLDAEDAERLTFEDDA